MKKLLLRILLVALGFHASAFSASLEKAEMLNLHGLNKEATIELIDILFDEEMSGDVKAKSYYLLGEIAFNENKIAVALDTWRSLVEKYPDSEEAVSVVGRIGELAEVVGEVKKESVKNAVAASYLKHADFWSKGKSEIFLINSDFISSVDAASKWYDKVIAEFPGSAASYLAYEGKLRTLLGWEEVDRNFYNRLRRIDSSMRIRNTHIPVLLATFNNFEKEHPDASTLQAFRYQIAQAYWRTGNFDKTKEWLHLVIEKSGGKDTFYKDLAIRQLEYIVDALSQK